MKKIFLTKIKTVLAVTLAVGMVFSSYTPTADAASSSVKANFKAPREGRNGSVITVDGDIATATLQAGSDGNHRLYFDFQDGTSYTYNAGDLISVRYSSDLDLTKDEAIIGWSDASSGHIYLGSPKSVSSNGYMTYELPQDTAGKFSSKQPTYFRLKGSNGSAKTIKFGGAQIHKAGTVPSFDSYGPIGQQPTPAPTQAPSLGVNVGVPASDSTAGNSSKWSVSNTGTGGIATYTCSKAGADCRIQIPISNYKYHGGDLLSIRTDDFNPVGQEIVVGYSLSSGQHVYVKSAVSYHVGYVTFELPADSSGVLKSTDPTLVRIKLQNLGDKQVGDKIHIQGIDIHPAGTRPSWDDGSFREIFPEAKATGLAVTYYNDLYSRGFAWCTDEHCNEGYVYIIKKTGSMTVNNIDWSKATVLNATGSMVSRTEINNKDAALNGKVWHYFKAHITNLEPGATYFFKAGNEFDGFTEVGTIEVERPADEIDSLTFIHTTDSQESSQSGFERWAKVLRESYEKYPDSKFVAFTGDMSNDTHASWGTAGGNMMLSQWNWGLEMPSDVLLNTVILASSGNHDAGPYAFYDRFEYDYVDYMRNSDEDIVTGGVYSYEYGDNIFFINLDTNVSPWLDAEGEIWDLQKDWLISELEAHKDCEWKIVQLHKGLMSTGDHTGDEDVDRFREQLPPIFAKYGVDLVLQGHDHVYTRSATYKTGKNATGFDVSQVAPVVTQNYSFDKETRLWNEEPVGTHYVTINYSANKAYPPCPNEKHPEPLDEVIELGVNPIANNSTSVQPNLPMYGVVRIRGDVLCYDAYTYDRDNDVSTLYDTFSIVKDGSSVPTPWPTEAPNVTMDLASVVSDSNNYYTISNKSDGSLKISYNKTSSSNWHNLTVDLSGVDKNAYTGIKMTVKPSRSGMVFGITDNTDSIFIRNHWGSGATFNSTSDQVVTVNFSDAPSANALHIWCDPTDATGAVGSQTFYIKKIELFK
ncbi:MAG: metallophosphoesterase family protein [Lachnospiraceae bacterium]|nr:metallophosphoesterase family protein [Lachnospiraceae bacterium]